METPVGEFQRGIALTRLAGQSRWAKGCFTVHQFGVGQGEVQVVGEGR